MDNYLEFWYFRIHRKRQDTVRSEESRSLSASRHSLAKTALSTSRHSLAGSKHSLHGSRISLRRSDSRKDKEKLANIKQDRETDKLIKEEKSETGTVSTAICF